MSQGNTAANAADSTDMAAGKDDEDDEENEHCEWGPFRPAFCQRFRDPRWLLFCLCWVSFIQGMMVAGFVSVTMSTIERRFELSSTESGLIPSMYDIASVLCLVPVSYFGGIGKKSRYLGIGMFVLGLSGILFSVPHFTTGLYEAGNDDRMLCDVNRKPTDCAIGGNISNYKYLFYIAMLIGGAGGSSLFTLGPTFLDANVPNRSSSLYIAIYHAFNIVGPGIGYLAGGAFLEIYVDINKVDSSSINIDSGNSRFVGAWWIGYLLAGLMSILVAVPLYGFPSELPGSAVYRAEKDREVHKQSEKVRRPKSAIDKNSEKKKFSLHRILRSLKTILTNPTYMSLNLVAIVEGTLLSGFANFLPKVLEVMFNLPSSTAALYVGIIAIVAGATGTFIGGYLVKRFDLRVRGILKFSITLVFIGLLGYLIFIASCVSSPFAGVNIEYGGNPANRSKIKFFGTFQTHGCHDNCSCNMEIYNPVCGDDSLTYFSPCHAGCSYVSQSADPWKYENCSCIGQGGSSAELGSCKNSCVLLPAYLCVMALVMITTFAMTMPSLTVSLRSVPQEERSLALGIQWLFAKVLGFIPGPILFGRLIDGACLLWQSKCGQDGSCFFYDNEKLSYYLLAISIVGKSLSMLFFSCALYTYKTSSDEKEEDVTVESPRSSSRNQSKSKESLQTVATNGIGSVSAIVEPAKVHSIEDGSLTKMHPDDETLTKLPPLENGSVQTLPNVDISRSPKRFETEIRKSNSHNGVLLSNGYYNNADLSNGHVQTIEVTKL